MDRETSDTDNPQPAEELIDLVLAHVMHPNYQPVKPRVIAKKLGLPRERQDEVKKIVKRLTKEGRLEYGVKHLVRPPGKDTKPQEKRRQSTHGRFRRAAAGFGFVRPQTAPPGDRSQDIYIPAKKTMDAADGDLVAVRLKGKRQRGDKLSWAGEIVEVLQRQTHQFVGVYLERGGFGLVQVDGTGFEHPIYVGDPGAKNATPGDKVVIEMVQFPSTSQEGEAVIVEILGPRGEPGVDTLSIIREFDLPQEFPEDVLEESREVADAFDESNFEDRLDLTGTTVLTIDPVDARDFDDAISLIRLENGHWQLGVHIADVSHFVKTKSPLDRESRERATSVYLPDQVIPMLPEIISNNLASLQPNKARYTKTVLVEFTSDGARVSTEAHNAVIRSDRRFTYEEVDSFLANPSAWKDQLSGPVFTLLSSMHELAMVLRKRRLEHGSIELTLPAVKVDLDKKGRVSGAHLEENTESHQIIEEFMLVANEAVADWLTEQGLPLLRRIHEPPDPRKLKILSGFVRELGIPCESLESRFEIKRVIAAVAGRPESHAVNFAVLRSMTKARYGPEVEAHYALHIANYCHFTSPIRRYPDLTIHRMINDLLTHRRPSANFDSQLLLGEHCSQREQRAESAERELTKLKILSYLAKRIGDEMDAVVNGVERYGIFAQGTKLPADGFIHIDALVDDRYEFDPRTHSLTGHRSGNSFRLGDLIRVEIAHVDIDRRKLDFRLAGSGQKSSQRKTGPRKPRDDSGSSKQEKQPRRRSD